jgi:hypothetical protein
MAKGIQCLFTPCALCARSHGALPRQGGRLLSSCRLACLSLFLEVISQPWIVHSRAHLTQLECACMSMRTHCLTWMPHHHIGCVCNACACDAWYHGSHACDVRPNPLMYVSVMQTVERCSAIICCCSQNPSQHHYHAMERAKACLCTKADRCSSKERVPPCATLLATAQPVLGLVAVYVAGHFHVLFETGSPEYPPHVHGGKKAGTLELEATAKAGRPVGRPLQQQMTGRSATACEASVIGFPRGMHDRSFLWSNQVPFRNARMHVVCIGLQPSCGCICFLHVAPGVPETDDGLPMDSSNANKCSWSLSCCQDALSMRRSLSISHHRPRQQL